MLSDDFYGQGAADTEDKEVVFDSVVPEVSKPTIKDELARFHSNILSRSSKEGFLEVVCLVVPDTDPTIRQKLSFRKVQKIEPEQTVQNNYETMTE